MRRSLATLVLLVLTGVGAAVGQDAPASMQLPEPSTQGELSIEEGLQSRRSVREYATGSLQLEEVAQILWSAQGINRSGGYRTAPSAGALFPLEVYLVAGEVTELAAGVYRYRPRRHDLVPVKNGDARGPLAAAALGQEWVEQAPAVLVIAAVYERTARKYGKRASRYVHMEVGHAAQNVFLQAVARELATVMVGAFTDKDVKTVLGLPADHEPLALMPLGRPR